MTLHQALQRHEHDEKFLTLLGGVQGIVDRLDALLASHAPPRPDAVGSSAPLEVPVAVLLGAIAIRDRLVAALAVEQASPTEAAAPPLVSTESLLR